MSAGNARRSGRSPARAFTLIEVLLVLALGAVLAGLAVPAYRYVLGRSELSRAVQLTETGIGNARVRSMAMQGGGAWGYSAEHGVLYRGVSYGARDAAFDEAYPIAASVAVSGIADVSFAPGTGIPSSSGDIVLQSLITGDIRRVPVRDEGLPAPPPPDLLGQAYMKIEFLRIKNSGDGNATPTVHVGPDAELHDGGDWIPLKEGGERIIDESLVLGTSGFSVQRQDGFLRILAYGDLNPGGKEVVDARITLRNAVIRGVRNDLGEHETEQPFDGVENDGVGGDEIIIENGGASVLFKTRVTNAGDSMLLDWAQQNPLMR